MIKIFETRGWLNYELLDTGDGEKFERVGNYKFTRPFEDAIWPRTGKWGEVAGKFLSSKAGGKGEWQMSKVPFDKIEIQYKGIKFYAKPTPFRHFGFFPEAAVHWDFIETTLARTVLARGSKDRPLKFLNLFGYTGVASLFALRAGAEVTHVDASKQSIDWAKENQKLNPELALAPMRVIVDDVLKFLDREIKRGQKYDAIIMDPPKFGRGPKGEVWKIGEDLPKLLAQLGSLLSSKPLFVILTSYATDSSSLSLGNALEHALEQFDGRVEAGELCIKEFSHGRLIPLANTAVWVAG